MNWKRIGLVFLAWGGNLLLMVLAWAAAITEIKGCANLLLFLSWVMIITISLHNLNLAVKAYQQGDNSADDKLKPKLDKLQQSYLNGFHAPKWCDIITYLFVVVVLVYSGWIVTGIIWMLLGIFDLDDRKKAMDSLKPKAEPESPVMSAGVNEPTGITSVDSKLTETH
jgi:hypothetical protein